MAKNNQACASCGKSLSKDEIALNKKMISLDVEEFDCLECLSLAFGCSASDLEIKIDEFKEQGCTLFI